MSKDQVHIEKSVDATSQANRALPKPPGGRKLLDLMGIRPRATSIGKGSHVSSSGDKASFPVARSTGWKRVKMVRAMNSLMKTEDGLDRPKAFANTYHLNPDHGCRFSAAEARSVLEESLRTQLKDVAYDATRSKALSLSVAETARGALKQLGWKRYKLVVYVVLGEQRGQGLHCASRCVWNSDCDGSATASYMSSAGLYATATVYAVYYD